MTFTRDLFETNSMFLNRNNQGNQTWKNILWEWIIRFPESKEATFPSPGWCKIRYNQQEIVLKQKKLQWVFTRKKDIELSCTSKFECQDFPEGKGITISLSYGSELYDFEAMCVMYRNETRHLQGIVYNDAQKKSYLEKRRQEEKDLLLFFGNKTNDPNHLQKGQWHLDMNQRILEKNGSFPTILSFDKEGREVKWNNTTFTLKKQVGINWLRYMDQQDKQYLVLLMHGTPELETLCDVELRDEKKSIKWRGVITMNPKHTSHCNQPKNNLLHLILSYESNAVDKDAFMKAKENFVQCSDNILQQLDFADLKNFGIHPYDASQIVKLLGK